MNSSVENFNENGYVLFKNILSEEEVLVFRRECEKIFLQRKSLSQGDSEYIRNNILMRSQVVRDIFFQDKILSLIKKVCGQEFCILPSISIMHSQYGGWHKDTTSVELFGYDFHKEKEFRIVNVAIYFQDNGEFGGGLDVVPGSHKSDDTFVDYFRNKEKDFKPYKRNLLDVLKSIKDDFKLASKKILLKSGFSLFRHFELRKPIQIDYPLDSSDVVKNKHQIPSKAGDIVIFDLRLDHKASWPKKEIDSKSKQDKYAFFAICGSNNDTTLKHRDYLVNRSESQDAYKYLINYEIPEHLIELGHTFNVKIL
jgi:ectoine hydroxylase-related dioxygenase (phytanoyl-CoA dioxygenase family)